MNGRYEKALLPEQRMAIVYKAMQQAYFDKFPNGVAPGETFAQEFIRPFIEWEKTDSFIKGMSNSLNMEQVRELNVQIATLRNQCIKRMHGKF